MTPELLTKRCRCGLWLLAADVFINDRDGYAHLRNEQAERLDVAIFTNHPAADRAARAAGWQVLSESLGGDLCPACIEEGA